MSDSDVLLERALKDTASQEEPQAGLQRVLRAAILGVPNAGKTTLVNQLLGQKVYMQFVYDELCTFGNLIVQAPQLFGIVVGVVFLQLFAVSPKRHTTTRKAVGVFTQGNSQVVST